MRAIVLEGSAESVLEALKALEGKEIETTKEAKPKQSSTRFEELRKVKPESPATLKREEMPRKRRRKNRNKYAEWTKEDERKLKELYEGGATIKKMARELGRTPAAIRTRAKKIDVHRKTRAAPRTGYKWSDASKQKLSKTMKEWHARRKQQRTQPIPPDPAARFPRLETVNMPVKIVEPVFQSFLRRQGNRMEYAHDAYILGIEDVGKWNQFATEVMQKGRSICDYFGRNGDIVVIGDGRVKALEYR